MPGADLGVALSVTLVPGVCVFAWTWGLGFGVALARPASGLCLRPALQTVGGQPLRATRAPGC